MSNQEVLALQRMLNAQGYRDKNGNKLVEDGIWGPKTEYAWLSYQQSQAKKTSATPNKTTSYTQSKMEEDLAALLNKQVGKAVPVSPAAGAGFWTAYQTANDPNLKKLQAAMAADPQAAKAFSSPEKIRNEQQALNALGFTGQDGKKLREDGVLDLNTLVAYDKLTHNSSFFGNSNSPIMRAVNGKSTAPTANWMDQKIAADIQQIAAEQAQAAKEKAAKAAERQKTAPLGGVPDASYLINGISLYNNPSIGDTGWGSRQYAAPQSKEELLAAIAALNAGLGKPLSGLREVPGSNQQTISNTTGLVVKPRLGDQQERGKGTSEALDALQLALDAAGLLPGYGEAADGLNALISLARGNYLDAGLSAAAMIPVAGWFSTAGKGAKRALGLGDELLEAAGDAGRYGDEAADLRKRPGQAAEAAESAKKAVDLGKEVQTWGTITTLKNSATKPGVGGVSPVGRAFQKHAGNPKRAGTFVGQVSGNAQRNTELGAKYLNDILNNPNSTFTVRNTKAFGEVLDVRLPDGTGARWTADGKTFIGFLERYTY